MDDARTHGDWALTLTLIGACATIAVARDERRACGFVLPGGESDGAIAVEAMRGERHADDDEDREQQERDGEEQPALPPASRRAGPAQTRGGASLRSLVARCGRRHDPRAAVAGRRWSFERAAPVRYQPTILAVSQDAALRFPCMVRAQDGHLFTQVRQAVQRSW